MNFFQRERQKAAEKLERLKQENAERDRVAAIAESERPAPPPKDDFVKAEYGVPHCQFERTPEGFKVHFSRAALAVHSGLNNAGSQKGLAQGVGALLAVGVIGAVAAVQKAKGTNIEVTGDAVIIDGKKLARKDFAHFGVGTSWKGNQYEKTLAVLSYRYGVRSFDFGGAWYDYEATEVASALNHHLRDTPLAGEEDRASPEMLRVARPTDF